jgi:zinc transporter ZupT
VFFIPEDDDRVRKILDALLGVASGVMSAASYFSLLAPALEFAATSPLWQGCPVLPVVIGFIIGGGVMFYIDHILENMGLHGEPLDLMRGSNKVKADDDNDDYHSVSNSISPAASVRDGISRRSKGGGVNASSLESPSPLGRSTSDMERGPPSSPKSSAAASPKLHRRGGDGGERDKWRRIYLLVIAITLHNLPEGIAVGVGYGSAGAMEVKAVAARAAASAAATELASSSVAATTAAAGAAVSTVAAAAATASAETTRAAAEAAAAVASESARKGFSGAWSLALGIALQNFPEGLAVSLPLRREGMPASHAFMWGQLSGAVEPIGGVLGAGLVAVAEPVLPLAMSFAAGAMLFVVVDQLVPEAHAGSPRHATAGFLGGFALMMTMDVAL